MVPGPLLIYCAGKNARHAAIALEAGFAYGVCSGHRPHAPVTFLDLDYRRPDVLRHVRLAAALRPQLAVAGDFDTEDGAGRVLETAAALRPLVGDVVVVPKDAGLVRLVPAWCVVGLSVPTRFGATQAPYWEYAGRRLHLLGGSPHAQMTLWRYFGPAVVSVDGNSHQKAARYGTVWERGSWRRGAEPAGPDLVTRAFARSCANIAEAWRRLTEAAG